jgi:ABC-type glycerol-3-phosphate transport system substrate-binding protein
VKELVMQAGQLGGASKRRSRTVRRSRLVVTALAAALLSTVLSATPSVAQTSLLDKSMASLYRAAQKNGEDSITYAVSTGSTARQNKLAKLFNKKFPKVKIKFKETDFLSMGAVIQTEIRAGQKTADLAQNAFLGLKPLVDAGNVTYFDWAKLGVAANRIQQTSKGGFGVISGESLCNQTVWNRKYIKDALIPKFIEGFTTENYWKGKMVTEPNNAYACFGFRALQLGVDHEVEFAKNLKDNGMLFSAGYTQLFASGERPVAMVSSTTQISTWKSMGIDVGVKVYRPSGIIQNRTVMVKGTDSPSAAKLYAIWLTTPEASRAWETISGQGFLKDPSSPLYKTIKNEYKLDPADKKTFVYETPENFNIRSVTATAVRNAVT